MKSKQIMWKEIQKFSVFYDARKSKFKNDLAETTEAATKENDSSDHEVEKTVINPGESKTLKTKKTCKDAATQDYIESGDSIGTASR